jgi:hypothetical protein
MSAATISQLIIDLRNIDRKVAAIKQDRDEKSRALRKLQAREAMTSPAVQRAPQLACS